MLSLLLVFMCLWQIMGLASETRVLCYTAIGWIQILKMKQSSLKSLKKKKNQDKKPKTKHTQKKSRKKNNNPKTKQKNLKTIDASLLFFYITFLAALSAFLPVPL